MQMAYSKAWKMLKTAEAQLGFPLLETQTGGKGGGGAALTEKGAEFLARYIAFGEALEKEAQKQFQKYFG